MTDSLTALTERRAQIKAQITDNTSKFIKARMNVAPKDESAQIIAQVRYTDKPLEEIRKSIQTQSDKVSTDELKALAKQCDELEKQLADIDAEISRIQKAQREEERRLEEEKRKADEQARLEMKRQKQEQDKAQWQDAESKLKRNLADRAEKIIDILKVQIMPSLECVECNDKLTKRIFNHTVKQYQKMMNGSTAGIIEKKNHKKRGELVSKYSVQNAEGYENDSPLTEFDRAVLGVIISEFLAGNRYTTINIIFRALIGKIGEVGIYPFKNQKDAIVSSVIKLMGTIVDFSSVAESLEELKYTDKDGNSVTLKVSNLISADLVDAKINGQEMEGVIFFKDNSPLFKVADAKSQVIRYPHELLDVPNQNNTPRIISIKKYVMRRICEIKLHKQLTHTITFDDVFKRCRITKSPRKVKMDARNAIVKLFEHLQEKNFISSFEPVQQRGKFVSIKFAF